jgi:RND family efflux transporter MFP subunit
MVTQSPPVSSQPARGVGDHMKPFMALAGLSKRFSRPVLLFLWCAMLPSYVGAIEPEPLPDFDCVIEPSEIADLGSAVPGVIDKIYARRSDSIKKGEIVATLESSVASANAVLSRARAELTTSISLRKESAAFGSRTSERNQVLYEEDSISKQEIDKLDTETRIARLQVRQEKDNKDIAALTYDRAKAVLERHLIRSPIEGVVMEGFKSVGEYVEDDPIMRVAQIDPLHVEVILPVRYLGRLVPGRRAEVTPNVPGYLSLVATITRVDKVADAASGTFGVRLILPNSDHSVAGGLRCSLTFLPVEESAPELPRQEKSSEEKFAGEIKAEEIKTEEMKAEERRGKEEVQQRVAEEAAEPLIEMTDSRDCYRVGPLTNEMMAASLSDTISTLDRANEPRSDVEYNEKTGYRVFITFQQDQGAPLDIGGYLLDKGVEDFYRIRSGEDEIRVSVGVFGNELNAMAYQESLIEKGLEAELSEVHRESLWINLSLNSSQASRIELESLVKKLAPAASVKLTQCSR